MSPEEISKKLEELGKGLKIFDLCVGSELSERQVQLASDLFDLFRAMNWQFAFDSHKTLTTKDTPALRTTGMSKCGTPVKVRSCRAGHGDKTYFGILLGDLAQSIGHSVDKDGNMTAEMSWHNPAIFVPELKDVVFGSESWWGEIESEEDLGKLITDETIKNVWYMKAITKLTEKEEAKDEEPK